MVMKIAFGLNVLVLLSLLTLISPLSFADAAPPPPSLVSVHLVNNGVNETSVGQIVFHCAGNGNADIQIPLNCSAGTCTNVPKSTDSDCDYFPGGYFSYEYQGQNESSEMFNATIPNQHYYEYQLDVQSGIVTLISSNGYNPNAGICNSAFVLSAVLALFISKKEGWI